MLDPLKQWICDVCGEIIEKPDDGYVVWGNDKNNCILEGGFQIIHQSRCDNDKLPNSLALTDFLGQEGLNNLLRFLSLGPIMTNITQHRSKTSVIDMDEFVDFFRRVQVPYYEEARTKFKDPDLLDAFSDANELYPYQVKVLKRIVEEY